MEIRPRKINLNDYELVASKEELKGFAGIIITPSRTPDGYQPMDLYYRKDFEGPRCLKDVDGMEWFEDAHISKSGTDIDYAKRVEWWFNGARSNPEFKEKVNHTFNKYEYDVITEWERACAWLKGRAFSGRKTNIKKFVWSWLSKGFASHCSRKKIKNYC